MKLTILRKLILVLSLISPVVMANTADTKTTSNDFQIANRFAQLALACVHKEYPNIIKHMMTGDEHVKPPKQLYPAFYGCFDWHSSVHGHWLLTRIASQYPETPLYQDIIKHLDISFTEENITGEVAYFNREGTGTSFERPYGLAWFLQLTSELRDWGSPRLKDG